MTSNENSLNEVKEISHYHNQALMMINIFKQEEEGFFLLWLNKFEYVANMIEVPYNKMAKLFLTMLHDSAHEPVKNHFDNVQFSEISYNELIEYFLRYYSFTYVYDSHQMRFFLRKQYVNEPIKKYATNLKKLIINCCYGQYVELNLYKQFINGIREMSIKTCLRRNFPEFVSYISFNEIVTRAVAFEKQCEISYYLNPALSMINIFGTKNGGDFCAWLNKFEYVAKIIEVPDDRMIEFFEKMVGNDVHQTVMQNFSSVSFSSLSYEEIVKHYFWYFYSSFETDLDEIRIMCRIQYEDESIQQYANNLKEMYIKCSNTYGTEKKLCEQFIGGIRNDDLRSHLNKTPNLSLDETVLKAIAFLEGNQITHYLCQALSLMKIFKLEEKTYFPMWFNKFEYVADEIETPDDKKGELFVEMVNDDVNNYIIRKSKSVNISELTYEQIINSYFIYLYSTVSDRMILFQRRRFTYRNQYVEESIEKYSNNLRKLYNKCNNINDDEFKLRTQFIKGIIDDYLRNHLKNISDLSFNELVAEAISFEKANDISEYLKPALSIINAYNPMKEGMFHTWLNKFEYVANLVKVPDNKLGKFFIKMVDNNVHTCVKKYHYHFNFSILSYEQIINKYSSYFYSNVTDLNEKRFFCRNQYEQETIEDYADNLEKMYNKCNFTNFKEEKLIEQFIEGIRDELIGAFLLRMKPVSFDRTVEIANKLTLK